jgi:hypothetical protein
MNDQENNKAVFERIAANKLLILMAGNASSAVDKFSSWLLTGFGVAFTLILTNIDSIVKFIPLSNIRDGILLYLFALFLGVIQKWLSSIISSGCGTSGEAEQIGKDLADSSKDIDIDFILNEIERSTYYPAKWLVSFQYNKVKNGDLSAPGRMFGKLAQIQSYLVLAQAIFVIYSITVLISGFNV